MKKKVLIVDDEVDFANLLRIRLENTGYIVIAAHSGEDAIALAEKDKPNLILLDIMMPGIDGYETLKRLKENSNTKDIPVIMISCMRKEEGKSDPKKIESYIVKPYEKENLLQSIEKALKIEG